MISNILIVIYMFGLFVGNIFLKCFYASGLEKDHFAFLWRELICISSIKLAAMNPVTGCRDESD